MNKSTKFITGMLAIFTALVPLVFGMAGCAQGTEQDQGQGQQSQPEESVLTVAVPRTVSFMRPGCTSIPRL
jgi:hypothetical protein